MSIVKSLDELNKVVDTKIPMTNVKNIQDWNGINITQAEVEAMGVTVQGTEFNALIYPDGSIIGSTSNGNFEIRSNGTYIAKVQHAATFTLAVAGSIYRSEAVVVTTPVYGIEYLAFSVASQGSSQIISVTALFDEPASSSTCYVLAYTATPTSTDIIQIIEGKWK